MERLTRRCNGVVVDFRIDRRNDTGDIPCEVSTQGVREILVRLAEYEDTRLSPTGCAAAKKADELLEKNGIQIAALLELLEACEEGRIVVLPCKPGTEVWVTRHDKVWPMYFVAPTLSAVCPDMPVHCQKETCADGPCKAYFGTDAREFGKTVFLSREEAEKALERMKCDGN